MTRSAKPGHHECCSALDRAGDSIHQLAVSHFIHCGCSVYPFCIAGGSTRKQVVAHDTRSHRRRVLACTLRWFSLVLMMSEIAWSVTVSSVTACPFCAHGWNSFRFAKHYLVLSPPPSSQESMSRISSSWNVCSRDFPRAVYTHRVNDLGTWHIEPEESTVALLHKRTPKSPEWLIDKTVAGDIACRIDRSRNAGEGGRGIKGAKGAVGRAHKTVAAVSVPIPARDVAS